MSREKSVEKRVSVLNKKLKGMTGRPVLYVRSSFSEWNMGYASIPAMMKVRNDALTLGVLSDEKARSHDDRSVVLPCDAHVYHCPRNGPQLLFNRGRSPFDIKHWKRKEGPIVIPNHEGLMEFEEVLPGEKRELYPWEAAYILGRQDVWVGETVERFFSTYEWDEEFQEDEESREELIDPFYYPAMKLLGFQHLVPKRFRKAYESAFVTSRA